jgi:uncharacterized protein (DUF1697 family)
MARQAVLLRGVNVGGRNRLAMGAFRSLLEELGCRDVATYLQSGNAVVRWAGSGSSLEKAVEQALRDRLDLPVSVLVRSARQLDAAVAGNPFAGEQLDPTQLHVVFLSGQLDPGVLDEAALRPDRVAVGDRLLYVHYAGSSRDSPAAKLLGSKRFPLVATARNWRTVLALRDLAHA